jgi:hypothetical protein
MQKRFTIKFYNKMGSPAGEVDSTDAIEVIQIIANRLNTEDGGRADVVVFEYEASTPNKAMVHIESYQNYDGRIEKVS